MCILLYYIASKNITFCDNIEHSYFLLNLIFWVNVTKDLATAMQLTLSIVYIDLQPSVGSINATLHYITMVLDMLYHPVKIFWAKNAGF